MAELAGAFAWKPQVLSDEVTGSDSDGRQPVVATPERVSQVVWPPVSPDALGMQRPSAVASSVAAAASNSIEARGRFRKKAGSRGDDKAAAAGDAAPPAAAAAKAVAQQAPRAQRREDGWLPKAEYEAKKREERARRQREREQASAAGGTGSASRSGRANNTLWEGLPKRPDPPKDTPEARKQREEEEAQLRARDMLRGASSAEEMRAAIAAARELGLVEEARLGERKLATMDDAS